MRNRRLTAALLSVALGLAFGLTACKKKPAEKGSAGSPAAMDSMDENGTDQPPPRPVERPADPMGDEAMAPVDKDPDDSGMGAVADPTVPVPGQATARMILIPWKDAENLVEELKRTKAEAKTLAETVLKEAKANPNEKAFTALVKKHSMGPTKENGGKVGPFGPKDVPEYIAKAVFALPKGGVSEIVETPSGFHIFMRTE